MNWVSGLLFASLLLATGCGKAPSPPVVAAADAPSVEAPYVAPAPSEPTEPSPKDPSGAPAAFRFTDDRGGAILEKRLTPTSSPMHSASQPPIPTQRKLPYYLTAPTSRSTETSSMPPRLPLPTRKPFLPVALPDRVPSDLAPAMLSLPERGEIPTGPLTKVAGVDSSKPTELPILSAKPVPDRAPLTDPTLEFTARSVISANLPLRTQQTGFMKFNLPDPFEHSEAARPRTIFREDPNRALGTIPSIRQAP